MTLQTTDFILLRRLTNDAFQGVDKDLDKGFYSETNQGGISEASAIFLSQAHTQLSDLSLKLARLCRDA